MTTVHLLSKNVPLVHSLVVVQEVKLKFQLLKGIHGKVILLKLQTVFEQNEGLKRFEKISEILKEEDTSSKLSEFFEDYS